MSRDKIINYKSENYKTCKHCINQVHKDCINKINDNDFTNYSDKYNNAYLCDSCTYDLNITYKDADDNDLKNKCFCDYCDAFVETSECTAIDINDSFEVACNECYNNLYKDYFKEMERIINNG